MNLRWLLASMRDAVLTVSPNKQYLGIFNPTTPATQGPIITGRYSLHQKIKTNKFDPDYIHNTYRTPLHQKQNKQTTRRIF